MKIKTATYYSTGCFYWGGLNTEVGGKTQQWTKMWIWGPTVVSWCYDLGGLVWIVKVQESHIKVYYTHTKSGK